MKKILPYIIILILVCVALFSPKRATTPQKEVVRDTVYSIDTVRVSTPVASNETIVRYEPYLIPMPGDTVRDTLLVYIPITQKVYRDSLYTAWVSGYSAKLDSIEVYNRTQAITISEKVKRKRFGIGLQVGYGFPHGTYAGIGLSYNLFNL